MLELLKKIITYLSQFKQFGCETGCTQDTRPPEEREKDWLHEEVNAEKIVETQEIFLKKKPESTPFIVEDQGATNTCVPHAVTLCIGINFLKLRGFFARLSKAFIYRLRSNSPGKGMWLQNAFEIVRNVGVCSQKSLPTPSSEYGCNNVFITNQLLEEAKIFKGNYLTVQNARNIDTLAKIASEGIAIAITIFATRKEWSQEYVQVLKQDLVWDDADVQHAITVLPNSSFIENGIKYLTIQDSAWFGNKFLRRLPEDFIKLRLTGAIYSTDIEFEAGTGPHPIHTFDVNKSLKYGMQNDEVRALQRALQHLGYFPKNQTCTGYFGGITRGAVRAFQDRFADEILEPAGVEAPTGFVGKNTLTYLNKIYGV